MRVLMYSVSELNLSGKVGKVSVVFLKNEWRESLEALSKDDPTKHDR